MKRKILDFSIPEIFFGSSFSQAEEKLNWVCALELVPRIFDLRNLVLQLLPVSPTVQGPEARHHTRQPISFDEDKKQ